MAEGNDRLLGEMGPSSSATSNSPNPPKFPCDGAKGKAYPAKVPDGIGAGAAPTALGDGEADALARQGRRDVCEMAESGASGEASPAAGEVRYEIELRLIDVAPDRGRGFEKAAEEVAEVARRPGMGERLRAGVAGEAELAGEDCFASPPIDSERNPLEADGGVDVPSVLAALAERAAAEWNRLCRRFSAGESEVENSGDLGGEMGGRVATGARVGDAEAEVEGVPVKDPPTEEDNVRESRIGLAEKLDVAGVSLATATGASAGVEGMMRVVGRRLPALLRFGPAEELGVTSSSSSSSSSSISIPRSIAPFAPAVTIGPGVPQLFLFGFPLNPNPTILDGYGNVGLVDSGVVSLAVSSSSIPPRSIVSLGAATLPSSASRAPCLVRTGSFSARLSFLPRSFRISSTLAGSVQFVAVGEPSLE